MIVKIYLKNKKEPEVYNSDRVDILDYKHQGINYKQIRYFKKGFSKSVYVEEKAIKKIIKENRWKGFTM